MTAKQKPMTLKKLRTLVESCLTEEFTLAFFLPDAETRSPTWKVNLTKNVAFSKFGRQKYVEVFRKTRSRPGHCRALTLNNPPPILVCTSIPVEC